MILTALHYILLLDRVLDGDFKNMALPLTDVEMMSYEPLYKEVTEQFPISGDVKIPRLIHQTWKDTNVPTAVTSWVRSWLQVNPGYEYYFWTDETARALISERHRIQE